MDRNEKQKLRAAIRDMAGTISAKGNAMLLPWMLNRNQEVCNRHFDTLCKLKGLMPDIYKEGDIGFKARVEFLKTVWVAGIYKQVISYQFFDVFDIGERQYDTCYEMGDGEAVTNDLVRQAESNPKLMSAAVAIYGDGWQEFRERVNNSGKPLFGQLR
jgi:hypothetical protein